MQLFSCFFCILEQNPRTAAFCPFPDVSCKVINEDAIRPCAEFLFLLFVYDVYYNIRAKEPVCPGDLILACSNNPLILFRDCRQDFAFVAVFFIKLPERRCIFGAAQNRRECIPCCNALVSRKSKAKRVPSSWEHMDLFYHTCVNATVLVLPYHSQRQ